MIARHNDRTVGAEMCQALKWYVRRFAKSQNQEAVR
jgi:hypothetical protein